MSAVFDGKLGDFLKSLFFKMKDGLLLAGWIGGILLLGGLLWGFTRSPREHSLRDAVNRALVRQDGGRRLAEAIPGRESWRGEGLRGTWYDREDGEGRILVFSIMAEGILIPCAATVSPGGLVEDLLPLTLSGEKALGRLSPGIRGIYIRRIEKGAAP